MASEGSFVNLQQTKISFNEHNSEEEIKKRMQWSNEKWKEEGESESSLKKLINSLRYWKNKIGKANSDKVSILTVFNVDSFARIDILEIVDAIEELEADIEIEGFSEFRNPRYIGVHFKTAKMKELVETRLRKVGSNYVVFMAWSVQSEIHNVRVHWLPMDHDIKNISSLLGTLMDIIEITKGSFSLMSGRKFKSGLLIFKARLKEGMKLEMLPHVTIVDGFETLITVYGRDPLCLTCNCLGHISANCPTPFCRNCKSLHIKKQYCDLNKSLTSYAQKVKGKNYDTDLELALEGCDQPPVLEKAEVVSSNNVASASKVKNKFFFVGGSKCRVVGRDKSEFNKRSLQVEKSDISSSQDDVSSEEDALNDNDNNESAIEDEKTSVLSMMTDHFTALQKLNLPDLQGGKDLLDSFKVSTHKAEPKDENNDTKMEVSGHNLKRKIKSLVLPSLTPARVRGLRKSYGRNVSTLSSSASVSSNMFDALLDGEDYE